MVASSEWGECCIKLQNLIKGAIKVICLTKSLVMNNSFCILIALKCLKLEIILLFNHGFKLLHIQTVPAFYPVLEYMRGMYFLLNNLHNNKIYRCCLLPRLLITMLLQATANWNLSSLIKLLTFPRLYHIIS
jgi:hypothetical protein